MITARALDLFDSGLSCSESILQAACEELEIDNPLVPKIATGFGGGICRTKSLCGAVAGAVMALGVQHGRTSVNDERKILIDATQELIYGFRDRFGGENCFELTGLDFNTPEGQRAFTADIKDRCRRYITFCTEFVEKSIG